MFLWHFILNSVPVVALLLGLWLLVRSWRGKRIDEVPVCRRCKFDLRGSWPASVRCPECGANLTKRTIQIGHRRPHAILVLVALAIVLPSMWMNFQLWKSQLADTDQASVLPSSMLVREVVAKTNVNSVAARDELYRRLHANSLERSTIQSVVEHALGVQADGKSWQLEWGDFIDLAWHQGHLSSEQQVRFAIQGVEYRRRFRPIARAGAEGLFQLQLDSNNLTYRKSAVSVSADCVDVQMVSGSDSKSVHYWRSWSSPGEISMCLDVHPGNYLLRTTWHVSVFHPNRSRTVKPWDRHIWPIQFEDRITVLPSEHPSVAWATPTELERAAFRKAWSKPVMSVNTSSNPNDQLVRFEFPGHPWPNAGAFVFDVIAHIDGRELLLGTFDNQDSPRWQPFESVNIRQFGTSSIIPLIELRPNLHRAESTLDAFQIWDEPIMFTDVPLPVVAP